MVNYVGRQYATRKIKPPSQGDSGPWISIIIKTENENIYVTTLQKKWDKGKAIICNILAKFRKDNDNPVQLNHKQLERDQWFIVHSAITYYWMEPFFKSIHLTLES